MVTIHTTIRHLLNFPTFFYRALGVVLYEKTTALILVLVTINYENVEKLIKDSRIQNSKFNYLKFRFLNQTGFFLLRFYTKLNHEILEK